MYPAAFRYHRAQSIEEASQALQTLGPGAKVLAGGQTLLPLMKLRLVKPTDLVDLSGDVQARRRYSESDFHGKRLLVRFQRASRVSSEMQRRARGVCLTRP